MHSVEIFFMSCDPPRYIIWKLRHWFQQNKLCNTLTKTTTKNYLFPLLFWHQSCVSSHKTTINGSSTVWETFFNQTQCLKSTYRSLDRISQEISQCLHSEIRTYVLCRRLVAIWCNCDCLAWCHSNLVALPFQSRVQISKLYNVFSRYQIVCVLACI